MLRADMLTQATLLRTFELFAVTAPGLEAVVAAELRALGHPEARPQHGGVSFRGDLEAAARANLWLRAATRVLLRVAAFDAPGRRELAARARRFDWSPFVAPGASVRMQVASSRSRLYHTGLISEVLLETLGLTSSPRDEIGAPEFFVRLANDRCTISMDTSGELLHRRGHRQETSRAPLRETLAAALLMMCGYDGRTPFLDPMCGAGTIALEAALIATGRAPGRDRAFALERFPDFDERVFDRLKQRADEAVHPAASTIEGSDLHAGALAAATRNAERAGFGQLISFERADVASLTPSLKSGLLMTNPPYGKRVGATDAETRQAWSSLGTALKGPFRTWKRAVLGPPRALSALSVRPSVTRRLDNGGIPVELAVFEPDPSPAK